MFCPKCGKEQPDNPKFCRNCGVKLTGNSASVPVEADHPQTYRQMKTWLVASLGIITFMVSFFGIEHTGYKGQSYILGSAITGVITGILSAKPKRAALIALLAAVVGSLILILLGYRMFEGPSDQALEEQSLSNTITWVLIASAMEAPFFGAIAGAITEAIRNRRSQK